MKKMNQKGFTLAELLIVVAIIAVLVAVSIPVFTSQLEKSREETDTANLRSAFAIAQTDALTEDYLDSSAADYPYTKIGSNPALSSAYFAYYNIKTGSLSKDPVQGATQGKATTTPGGCDKFVGPNMFYDETVDGRACNIVVIIDATDGGIGTASAGLIKQTKTGTSITASSDFEAFS